MMRRRPDFWKPLFGALGGALLLWFLWGFFGVQLVAAYWGWVKAGPVPSVNMSDLGQTGDLFGGINALFAAFAFAGVALAAFYQYETWKLQTEETQMARTEHVQQSFEPLFFKLLERFESVNERARKAFDRDWNHVVGQGYIAYRSSGAENEPLESKAGAEVVAPFLRIYEEHHPIFGPYFRSLFQIFKFISNSKLTSEQKVLYANIARTNLSEVEVTMLGFNCLTGVGRDFVPYVEAYGLLKHVKDRDANEIFRAYYSPSAFMSSRRRFQFWSTSKQARKPHFLVDVQEANK